MKDLEVIYFTDPIDEYTMQNLTEFDEYKFSNASKEDLKFGDADDKVRSTPLKPLGGQRRKKLTYDELLSMNRLHLYNIESALE